MRRSARVPLLMIALALAVPEAAWAQRSGGRFGGSRSFGGGSSSRSSSSSSSYRSSSSSSSYRSSSSYTSSSYRSSSVYGGGSSYSPPPPPPPPPRIAATRYVRPAPVEAAIARDGVIIPPVVAGEERPEQSWDTRVIGHRAASPIVGIMGALVPFALMGTISLFATRGNAGRGVASGALGPSRAPGAGGAAGTCTVRRVSIAFDWTERAKLQASLDAIASQEDMSTERGLHRAAHRARDLVLLALPGARYAVIESAMDSPAGAQSRFERQANALRERYEVETRNNARTAAAPAMTARSEEGAGFVLVTLLVGTDVPLPAVSGVVNRETVAAALRTLVPAEPRELVALEVIWSPSRDEDRMSSAELEVVYPELQKLAGAESLGRRGCAFCGVVYAGELGRCPSCGAAPSPK